MLPQKSDKLYGFIQFYRCDYGCDSHMLRVVQFKDDKYVSISKFHCDKLPTFFYRVKQAIGYIFNPQEFDIYGDIIFSPETIYKLSRDLLKISQTVPKDLITGQVNCKECNGTGRNKKCEKCKDCN